MTPPCPRCEREVHPVDLEAGRRCRHCNDLIYDASLRVLLDGIRVPRRWRLTRWSAA